MDFMPIYLIDLIFLVLSFKALYARSLETASKAKYKASEYACVNSTDALPTVVVVILTHLRKTDYLKYHS